MIDPNAVYTATRMFDEKITYSHSGSFADATEWALKQMVSDAEWARPRITYNVRVSDRRVSGERRKFNRRSRTRIDRREHEFDRRGGERRQQ